MKKGPVFIKVQMSEQEISLRKQAARTYKLVLQDTNENELVLAHRQHGLSTLPAKFPIYAFYNDVTVEKNPTRRFFVVRPEVNKYVSTGQHISENGRLWG